MSDFASSDRGDRVKLFTLDEANSLIPWVRESLQNLIEHKQRLGAIQESLARLTPRMRGNGHRNDALSLERELERIVEMLAQGLHDLEKAGIQLKDLDAGILDFPALHRGRIVLLCWRLGEDAIEFWHEISTGFAGRRPIAEFGR